MSIRTITMLHQKLNNPLYPPRARLQPFRPQPRRIPRLPRAQKEDDDFSNQSRKSADGVKDVEKMLQELNINRDTAKQVLKVWRSAGVTDPEDLRRLFVKRGVDRSTAVAMQLAVDASSALIAWYSGYNLASTRALGPFTLAAEFVVYTLAMYLTINATLDIFSLVAVGVATKRYSTSTAGFLEAVENLAGPDSGLDVVDKARKAVVTVQVLKALDQILERLKLQAGSEVNQGNFLRDLGAYMVLLKASESGYDPVENGVSIEEAADVAAEFAMVDGNDDLQIDLPEFRKLCARLSPGLSDEECEAAMSVLDTDKNGSVDFREFVDWWRSAKV